MGAILVMRKVITLWHRLISLNIEFLIIVLHRFGFGVGRVSTGATASHCIPLDLEAVLTSG